MEAEGNIWLEAWDNAKPVPARRQKRLFDDTREAEKVLQYMTALKPSEVADMLIPVLQHASVVRILDETQDEDTIPQLSVVLQDAMQKLSALSRLRCLPEVKHFTTLETDDSLSSELGKYYKYTILPGIKLNYYLFIQLIMTWIIKNFSPPNCLD